MTNQDVDLAIKEVTSCDSVKPDCQGLTTKPAWGQEKDVTSSALRDPAVKGEKKNAQVNTKHTELPTLASDCVLSLSKPYGSAHNVQPHWEPLTNQVG